MLSRRHTLAATVALGAALVAAAAEGALFRPEADFSAGAGKASIRWVADLGEPGTAGSATMSTDPTVPHSPVEPDNRQALQGYEDILAGATGACGSPPPSQSFNSGSTSAAAPGASSVVPEPVATSWLPDEMGPAFCNPPPRTLFRPPRSSIASAGLR